LQISEANFCQLQVYSEIRVCCEMVPMRGQFMAIDVSQRRIATHPVFVS